MKGIVRRPLALMASVFLLTLFFLVRKGAMGGSFPALLAAGTILLLAVFSLIAGVLCPDRQRRLRIICYYGSALLLTLSLAIFTAWRIDPLHTTHVLAPYEGETVAGILTVEKVEHRTDYSTRLIGALHSANGNSTDLQGRFTLPYSADLQAGDEIELSFTLHLLRTDGKLSNCYDLSQGLFFEAQATEEEFTLLSRNVDPIAYRYEDLQRALRRQLYPYLSDEDIGLSAALLLGDKSTLSSDLRAQFQNLGISHTLAVSGLHLGILFVGLAWIFRKLCLPRWLHLPILLPLLFLYTAMVGSPSVLRAGGMLLFLFAAYYFGRLRDSITSLFATVTVICLVSPYSILDVGLLLSFFATFGILLITPVCAEKLSPLPPIPRGILNALIVTLSATLFTMPFTVFYFGHWAVLSFAANLILVPIITLILYLLPLLFLLSPFPILAHTPAKLIETVSAFVREIAAVCGSDDRLLLPLQYPAIETAAVIGMVAVALLCLFRKTRPFTLAALIVFLAFAGIHDQYRAEALLHAATVHPISDGENDCLLLRQGTRVLLIDRSEGKYDFIADAITAAEKDPLIRVDAILLTHYHYRQISSLTRLLADRRIEHLILPAPSTEESDVAHILMDRAKRNGCSVEIYTMETSCIGYHDWEIGLDYYPDNALRSITVGLEEKRLVYTEDIDLSDKPYTLPAHYRNQPEQIDSAWNRIYSFPLSVDN